MKQEVLEELVEIVEAMLLDPEYAVKILLALKYAKKELRGANEASGFCEACRGPEAACTRLAKR